MEVFNPLTRSWAVSPSFKFPAFSRAYHGMETAGSSIWVVGGYSLQVGFLRSFHQYNLQGGLWSTRSPMSTARCDLETQLLDGKIFAIGGHAGLSGEMLKSGEVYTIATNQWAPIADMNHPHSHFASVVLAGDIYVVGGFNGVHYQTSIERYTVAEDRWTVVGHLAGPRSDCSAVVANGRIFVLGGFNGSVWLLARHGGVLQSQLVGLVSHQVLY